MRRATTWAMLSMLGGCCALCPPPKPPEPDPRPLTDAGGGATVAVRTCGFPQPKTADTCRRKGNHFVCDAYVGGTPDEPWVYPNVMFVGARQDIVIVWHAVDGNARFEAGHGVTIGNPGNQFTDPANTDDADGENPGAGNAGKHHRVKYANTERNKRYKYSIKFKAGNGQVVECDPTIVNSTG